MIVLSRFQPVAVAGFFLSLFVLHPSALTAQEPPYFVTYTHHMEEPGSLEISTNPTLGKSKDVPTFLSAWTEIEYGAKAWWTTELYLDVQKTRQDSTLFTGYRFENRFRVLMNEHRVNPVLYLEYEGINDADKTLKEVVGFDSKDDQAAPNGEARREKKRELETKLILSSNFLGWNLSENLVGEKNLNQGEWEFGYTVGTSRPLALAASANRCSFCRENFVVGAELYGGLGTWNHLKLQDTSHYLAPVVAWNLPSGVTFRISPGIGLTQNSHGMLMRFGVSREIAGFGRDLQRMFGRRF